MNLPGLEDASEHVYLGIDWLSSVAFEHTEAIGKRVELLPSPSAIGKPPFALSDGTPAWPAWALELGIALRELTAWYRAAQLPGRAGRFKAKSCGSFRASSRLGV